MATVATGGLMLAFSLMGASAQAQTLCTSGLPISTIASSGIAGYTCRRGSLTYRFANDIAELNFPNLNGYINFSDTPTSQDIVFTNLAFQGLSEFSYDIDSTTDTITSIVQTYTQDIATAPPILSEIFASLPSTIVSVTAVLETDMSMGAPDNPTLTSLTHRITMIPVPGPLPVIGTALGLGFTRKLRGRIQRAKRQNNLSSQA
ncbi:MAG: hypothetical protein FJ083_04590 [Cyanobacteria bacterium K_Offshore_surface_m2_239]|nr:hypothetical protein [Cyanobacteria bacterium K_Offshore_surface_m2_239]